MMELRDYQDDAVKRILWAYEFKGADLICLPTGAGKSLVIADAVHKLNTPTLILSPSQEITLQNYEKMSHYVRPSELGIYCASLKEKEIKKFTFGTIQSVYKKPELFAHFDTIIIDECDMVNPKNLEGMFTNFISAVNNIRSKM